MRTLYHSKGWNNYTMGKGSAKASFCIFFFHETRYEQLIVIFWVFLKKSSNLEFRTEEIRFCKSAL